MKCIYPLVTILTLTAISAATQLMPVPTPQGPLIINLNIYNDTRPNQTNSTTASTATSALTATDIAGASAQQTTPIEVSIPIAQTSLQEQKQEQEIVAPPPAPAIPTPLIPDDPAPRHFLKSCCTPTTIFLSVAGGTFAALWLAYFWYASALHSKRTWASWRENVPVEELYQFQLEHIRPQFINALNRRYGKKNPKPLLGSLFYQFERDIANELSMIHNYLRFHAFLQTTRLRLLLPSQENLYQLAQKGLKRLEFLEHLAGRLSDSITHG